MCVKMCLWTSMLFDRVIILECVLRPRRLALTRQDRYESSISVETL